MTYQILNRLLQDSIQEEVPVTPARLVVHSTANPGATDEDHFRWLNSARQHGWANYYLDSDSISKLVEEGMLGPAQGPTANRDSISFEMCEPATNLPQAEQRRQFIEVWNRAVWLAADILHRWGWGIDHLVNHNDITMLYPQETDHTDPIAFMARYGRSWEQFRAEVASALAGADEAVPQPEPWQQKLMDNLLQSGLISEPHNPMEPVAWWQVASVALHLLDRIERSRRFTELPK